MPVTTQTQLDTLTRNARKVIIGKASGATKGAGFYHDVTRGNTGLAPPIVAALPPTGSGETLNRTNYAGAFNIPARTTGRKQYISRFNLAQGGNVGELIICDRLWHNSGLDATLTTVQTVNSLTLPRHTTGAGVELYLLVYTVFGATASTFSVNYTDGDNVGQVATYDHPASAPVNAQMIPLTMLSRAGVKSVQSVQLSISTGTAGNFGLVMVKRIASVPVGALAATFDPLGVALAEIPDDSCVCPMWFAGSSITGTIFGNFDVIEV